MCQVSIEILQKDEVNWLEEFHSTPINIGSYGIHIMHNRIKAGVEATRWSVSSLLTSLYSVLSFQGLSCQKGGLCRGNRKFTPST